MRGTLRSIGWLVTVLTASVAAPAWAAHSNKDPGGGAALGVPDPLKPWIPWVLKGEERLPAAVRGLSPGPRVAALWMSLRDLFAGGERERAALRLRGTWDDPMVTQP